MPKVIEFPRRLEWASLEVWEAKVAGTDLWARVESEFGRDGYVWTAGNGALLVGSGHVTTLELGKEAARRSLEGSTVILRPLFSGNEA